MKIAVFADVHANLPALVATLEEIDSLCVDRLYHLGDIVGIGPFPSECLKLLLSIKNIKLIMGNHDSYLVKGIPPIGTAGINKGEYRHHEWIGKQISEYLKQKVACFPYFINEKFGNFNFTFIHYGLDNSKKDFVSIIKEPTADDLDKMFEGFDSEIVFYGHHHPESDIQGMKRYINPGSLGCFNIPVARFLIIEISEKSYQIKKMSVEYNDKILFEELEKRKVPDREFIKKAFLKRE